MKIKKKHLVAILLLIIIIIWGIKISTNVSKDYSEFAKCLTEQGTKIYGTSWCGVCDSQKEAFGKSWKYINYIECSLPNKEGQTQICKNENIERYPTWEFEDGSRDFGKLSFEQLSQKSGCELI